jgi:hypothetical protein
MEEFHKEDLEKFRVQILDYLSYVLNNTPISTPFYDNEESNTYNIRQKVHYLIDICLEAQREGIKFDRVKYVVEELKRLEHYYKDIMTMEQFFKAMERNEKLENLGI